MNTSILVKGYLVVRADGHMRVTKRFPDLGFNEVAFPIKVSIPDMWGRVQAEPIDVSLPEPPAARVAIEGALLSDGGEN